MGLRVGIGYDSHRLEEGASLIVGGVEIEHERGLVGHSDADVLAHAITDAVLGASGLGDIGQLFPPDEEQWRDADSIDMLRVALAQVGGAILNVDVTLICEEPKLEPHKAEISARLGEVLSAPVNVKAIDQRGDGSDRKGGGDRLHRCRTD